MTARPLLVLAALGVSACGPPAAAAPAGTTTPAPHVAAPVDRDELGVLLTPRPTPGWVRLTLHVAAGPLGADPPVLASLAARALAGGVNLGSEAQAASEVDVTSGGPLVRFRVEGPSELLAPLANTLAGVLGPSAEEALVATLPAAREALRDGKRRASALPWRRAQTLAARSLLGPGADPYAGDLAGLTDEAVLRFVRARYRRGAAHVAVEGDLRPSDARAAVLAAFREARPGAPEREIPEAEPPGAEVALAIERGGGAAAALAFTVPPARVGGAAEALTRAGGAQVVALRLPGRGLVLGQARPGRLEAVLAVAALPPEAFGEREPAPAADVTDAAALAFWDMRARRASATERLGLGVVCAEQDESEACIAEGEALAERERRRRAEADRLADQAEAREAFAAVTARGSALRIDTTTHAVVGARLTLATPGGTAGEARLTAAVLASACPDVQASARGGRVILDTIAPPTDAAERVGALLACATGRVDPSHVESARRRTLLALRRDPLGTFLGEGFGEPVPLALGLSLDALVAADARRFLRRARASGSVALRVLGPLSGRGRGLVARAAVPWLQRMGGAAAEASTPRLTLPRGLRATVGDARLAVVAHARAGAGDVVVAEAFAAALAAALTRRGARAIAQRAGGHPGGVHAAVLLAPGAQPLEALVGGLPAALGEARRAVAAAWTPARRRRWLAARRRQPLEALDPAPVEDATELLRELAAQPAVLVARPRRR